MALPSEAEEVWRYSRINELDLDRFSPVDPEAPVADDVPEPVASVIAAAGPHSGLIVLRNGRIIKFEVDSALESKGVVVGPLAGGDDLGSYLGAAVREQDAFTTLNDAFVDDGVNIDVPAGVSVEHPVVIVHWVDAEQSAVFPRLSVRAGEGSEVRIVDHVASPSSVAALVVPVVELEVGDAARVGYLGVQELGRRCWQIGYQGSRVGRDATLGSGVVALGGEYARIRTDSKLIGQGGTSNLLAVYFGDGEQVHDFRTLQDHDAPNSTSDLLFKGAVGNTARSVYSGLIRVRRGARGTNAFQTNRNLVLSEGAHADSVPNLEIEENDVRCSHASAVGPLDADQRFYLEARGVPTEVANRLILLGFFDEIVERLPVESLRPALRSRVADRLNDLDDVREAGR